MPNVLLHIGDDPTGIGLLPGEYFLLVCVRLRQIEKSEAQRALL
jgi:hypothetical protein